MIASRAAWARALSQPDVRALLEHEARHPTRVSVDRADDDVVTPGGCGEEIEPGRGQWLRALDESHPLDLDVAWLLNRRDQREPRPRCHAPGLCASSAAEGPEADRALSDWARCAGTRGLDGPRRLVLVAVGRGRRDGRDHGHETEHEGEQKDDAPQLHNLNLAYRFMDTRPIKFLPRKYR